MAEVYDINLQMAYAKVRDFTVLNDDITPAEALAVLGMCRAEIERNLLEGTFGD